jgi:GMP synthase (glutamine-hydrolysing)
MSPKTQSDRPQLLAVDLGSQHSQQIPKSFEHIGYRVALLGPDKAVKWAKANSPKGIILSGGWKSVNDNVPPVIPKELYELGVPMLNICLGMQDAAKRFGGSVESVESQRGYSRESLKLDTAVDLFMDMPEAQVVWASHGDSVTKVPKGFKVIATNPHTGGIAAMMGKPNGTPVRCVQFHPEVSNTKYGKAMLSNFAKLCKCKQDWKPIDMVLKIQTDVVSALGDKHAILGFSGGVDSTTLARILSPVLGERLHCVVIDGGQFRENEIEEIKRHAEAAHVKITIVRAKGRFLKAFGKVVHSERVRKIFQKVYGKIFREEAVKIARKYTGGKLSQVVLIQGTLAPDLIESGATGGALIKTHHNVGMKIKGLEQLHPMGNLFKYEVRALARKLGLPKSVSERQPFPGPGLFIRIPGLPKTAKNLAIARWIDARTREILERHGWYHRISQLVVTYCGLNYVGIKGDGRVYKPFAKVRAVRTIDYMTAEGVRFPDKVWREIETVLGRHKEISRVVPDSMHKPPATTEDE